MGRPRLYVNDAEKLRAYRERHRIGVLTVEIPLELIAALNEYLKFKSTTKNAVIEKLLRSQLLRKR